jgi:RNA polymerase sigma-70 factor, ECF subfamily
MKEKSDPELISLYLKGSNEAFDEFYTRYRRQLFAYLNRMLPGQPQLADDMFQRAWVKIIAKLPVYQERQTFLAWAIRISHNLVIDHFRKENRRATSVLEGDVEMSSVEKPDKKLDAGELGTAISQAVGLLPDDQREVFLLRQQEISFKEIAVIQEISLNTAIGRMHYALKKLRSVLKDWSGEMK